MSYKFKKGFTPDHQTNVSEMDGVDNVYKPITRMKESDNVPPINSAMEVKANPQNFSGNIPDDSPNYQGQSGLGGSLAGGADLIKGVGKLAKSFGAAAVKNANNAIKPSSGGSSGPVGGGPGSTGIIPKGLPKP